MKKISIIGMGYVGLPLAVAFQKYYEVVGFDLKKLRINDLKKGIDTNNQFSKKIFLIVQNFISRIKQII